MDQNHPARLSRSSALPRPPHHSAFLCALCGSAVSLLSGCAAPKVNTTTLTAADIVKMTDQMAADLAASPAIARRSADSEPWVFTLDEVTNRTEHLMDEGERWATMVRFRSRLAESMLAKECGIRFVLPAAQWRLYAEPEYRAALENRLIPTHTLRAEFRSDTTTSIAHRADHYLCAFQLADLRDGQVVWEDAYEVKYAVQRNRLD
jgi:hypothetical protein